jgi:PHD/YefM family antitoxin component YafN of YafNO toxin-antitoxin module
MKRLNLSKAQDDFPKIVSRAASEKERTVVSRGGKDVAAVVPIEDLQFLERIDRQDVQDARAALAEPGEDVSLEDMKQELGLP